jgi:hypothetical protein
MRDLQTVLVDTYPTAAMVLANPAYVSTTTKITAALAKANTEYGSTKPTAITSYPKLLQYLYYPAPKANVTTVIGMIYYKRTQTTNAWQEVLLSDKKTIASIGVPIKV